MAERLRSGALAGLFARLLGGLLSGLLVCGAAAAREAEPLAANAAVEARMMAVASELRCMVCQNQTIADSHADLAADLRQQIREMVAKGMSDEQIRHYMTDRYGDFVLYKPPLEARTVLLWAGPPALLMLALGALFLVLRHRQRLGADAFDPDTPEDSDPSLADR